MPALTIRPSDAQSHVQFSYQDSGAPDLQVYTTLVVVHGTCFHNATFQHIIPLATSRGFRMVCINRRDYPGTTLYTPAELKVVCEGDAGAHAAFLKARGEELAMFLDGIIDALSLPGPSPDGKEGGLALMGWSMGNMFTLGAIASISSLQPQVQKRLQLYLRKLIMFDPPAQALGIPGALAPALDPTMSPQEAWAQFSSWVSSYFAHGDLSTRKVENIQFMVPDLTRPSIAAALPPQEISSVTDYRAAGIDYFLFTYENVLFDQMHKALFDAETRSLWPKLDIWFLQCDSSAGMMVPAAWGIEKLATASENLLIKFLTIENAHHAVFWDEPEKALKAFDHCLRQ